MRISIVVAMDQNNGIGFQNRLPWHLPADLKRFQSLTMGHHLIMGRKTFESIGKPLPGRTTIVVTRNPDYHPLGCYVAQSVEAAIELAKARGEQEVFICGGTQIYRAALEVAHQLYLTRIHAEFQTDTSFPGFDVSLWLIVTQAFHPSDEANPYPFTFYVLERKA